MKSKLCLRCGGTCASYATQCIHCHHGFSQSYTPDKANNQKIISLLTAFRHGQPLDVIAASLNNADLKYLEADSPWDKQKVAHVIHHFTSHRFVSQTDPSIALCKRCRAPLIGSTCSTCKNIPRPAKPPKRTSVGKTALIFNIVVIAVLSLVVFYCTNFMNDGEGFHSNFTGFILSFGAFYLAAVTLLFGNILLILVAIANGTKSN